MKVLGSRFSFYVGFVVGTFSLYAFLRQVWFEKSFVAQNGSKLRGNLQQLEEDEKVWKKERSALFNLKHPHHTGASREVNNGPITHIFTCNMFQLRLFCANTATMA